MWGKNTIEKADHGDGQALRIVNGSPFLTIQGEGPYTGHPALFLRLHGCNLACWFCDTNFSDPNDKFYSIKEIVLAIYAMKGPARLLVITGGEPLRQNILPLCKMLRDSIRSMRIQIETAGTLWIDGIEQCAEIVCSPKTPVIHPMIKRHAAAFKYVISDGVQFDKFVPITATQAKVRETTLAWPRDGAPVYLSPCDEYDEDKNKRNRQKVLELALQYGCIAGCQLHKVLEVKEPT